MSPELIARLGIGGGPLLIAQLGIGEALTSGAVGASYTIEYDITAFVAADYAVSYRVEGRLPASGAGGPDDDGIEEWFDPRVTKYLDELRIKALTRFVKPEEVSQGSQAARHAAHNRVSVGSNPTPATQDDDVEEIAMILDLIDG